jgi:hypothetical protein
MGRERALLWSIGFSAATCTKWKAYDCSPNNAHAPTEAKKVAIAILS